MNQIKFWKTLVQNKKYKRLAIFLVGIITLIVSLLIHFWFDSPVEAKQPVSVLISSKADSYKGRGLNVRRGNNTRTEKVQVGATQLSNPKDQLIVEGDSKSYASLVHLLVRLSKKKPPEYGGLIMKTIPSKYSSNYWFSCIISGNYLMGWRQGGESRSCGDRKGLTIINRNGLTVVNINSKSSVNLDVPEIAKATKIKKLLVAQASDEITILPCFQRTIIQTLNSEIGITIDVIEGDIQVKSTRIPEEQIIKKGERYAYPQNTISTLDLDAINQKPEVKDFLDPASWSPPNVPSNIAKEIAEQLSVIQAPPPENTVDSTFIKTILSKHNYYRSIHRSPDLVIDRALNAKAQAWAERIASSGELAHSNQDQRSGSGENIYVSYTTENSIAPDTLANSTMQNWYDNEVSQYNYDSPGFSQSTGHFTQVVWKSTTQLGCGTAKGNKTLGDQTYNAFYVVCNYAPAGNVSSQFPTNVLKP
ncbi:CAP family protein [Phormidium tenue]|jgi:uncharacterized protein YkwD|nr:CAP family protein [Phormidium tenue]